MLELAAFEMLAFSHEPCQYFDAASRFPYVNTLRSLQIARFFEQISNQIRPEISESKWIEKRKWHREYSNQLRLNTPLSLNAKFTPKNNVRTLITAKYDSDWRVSRVICHLSIVYKPLSEYWRDWPKATMRFIIARHSFLFDEITKLKLLWNT